MRRLIVLAAIASVPTWGAEPSAIFGIEIGKPLTLPECSFSLAAGSKFYDASQQAICSETAHPDRAAAGVSWSRVTFPNDKAPLIAKWSYVNAYIYRGIVEGVEFPTAGISSQEVVLTQLKQKFGQPTSLRVGTAQNAMGAAFKTYEAEWLLPRLKVAFHGTLDTLDKGRVEICAPVLCALRSATETSQTSQRQGL